METRTALVGLALLLSVSLTGCGDSPVGATAKVKTYKVKGKVTMAGAAIASASVTFSPAGTQPAATAKTDTEGKFSLTTYDPGDGAAAGEYKILVTKEGAPAGAAATPGGHDPKNLNPTDGQAMHKAAKAAGGATAGSSSLLPSKYSSATTSDLPAVVKADDSNDFNVELKP